LFTVRRPRLRSRSGRQSSRQQIISSSHLISPTLTPTLTPSSIVHSRRQPLRNRRLFSQSHLDVLSGLIVLFVYLFIIFKFSNNFLLPKPWTRPLRHVSHHIVHRLSWSTLFPAAATGLSSHVFSPTLASRPSRTRTSTNAVDKLFLRTRSPLISLPFKFITLISSYQRT